VLSETEDEKSCAETKTALSAYADNAVFKDSLAKERIQENRLIISI
jgi:hypothetical protein